MRIAIYGRVFNDPAVLPYIQQVFDNLQQNNVEIYIHHLLHNYLKGNLDTSNCKLLHPNNEIRGFIDLFITLGGDGTLLDMVSVIGDSGIPIIGINFGRLGFLASINKNDIANAMNAVVNKQFALESRELLSIHSDSELFGKDNFALNDITIHKRDDSAMITTHVFLDEEFLNSYWGDGIIISTSTGSTGYSLSCGGPIIFPQSNSVVLTPIAPHNLNVRPIILPDTCTLSFEVELRSSNYLITCDSRTAIIGLSGVPKYHNIEL